MSNTEATDAVATVRAENIGGITRTDVEIPPGVTVLEGRNATNRTSFLKAVMGAIGSDAVALKGDADEGRIELTLDGKTYTRVLRRTEDGVASSGDPYLADPTLADLFAFLLESNEARRAVAQERDLREIIMRPVDTDEIRAEIDRLERERDRIDDEIEELDELKRELPGLEERRTDLTARIEAKRESLADTEAEIESTDAAIDETRAENEKLEAHLEDLRELRAELDDVRSEIELQTESIASLRREREELNQKLAELPEVPMGDHQHLDDEIARLRERKQSLETEMSALQNVIQFNNDVLDDRETAVTDALDAGGVGDASGAGGEDGEPTAQLLAGDSVTCWTCGSDVSRERIEETLERLRGVRQGYLDDVREIEADLEEVRERQQERKAQRRRREKLQRRLETTESELQRRQETLTELRARRDRLGEDVEAAEREAEQLESEDVSSVLDLHKEANQLEFDLGRIESELEDVTDRIETIEDRLGEKEDLQARREQIQTGLEEQRTRIDRIERESVREFNDRMEEVLGILEYDNLARIWIERVETTVRQGRGTSEQAAFELHVVRTTDANVAYEDTVAHLSESEREVTGLIFALAGYLVHDVHDRVPIMLLDSLEAIDSERIAALVEYIADHAEYLLVALLPEDAQAVSAADARITDI
ncbi:archaea-specific SMC-related protein [Natronomonas sp.]|uniref:archaea-specific SMC-related protein n=1 Tax=Natronomonas sp. TaxID=2184060 RepID=UPI00261531DE|nr:archaea-specific SMC-related protein [Natronomonas sp.]